MYFLILVKKLTAMKQLSPELDAEIDSILKEVGSRIREKRRAIIPNYMEFSKENNFNKVTLGRIETGKNSSLKQLIRLAKVLDYNLEDIFKGL